MSKPKKKLTKEEKLAKDRQRKREKYETIKNNPELYAIQKEKERKRYMVRKEQKKICSISDLTPRAQREQRKKWRKNSTKYLNKKKEAQRIERIIVENSPPPSEAENVTVEESVENFDPLQFDNIKQRPRQPTSPTRQIRKLRYRHMKIVRQLKAEINKLKSEKNNKHREQKNDCQEKEPVVIDNKDSVKKRVDEMVKDLKGEKVEEVKKKLLFGESLSKNLREEYNILNKKNKRTFVEPILKNRDQLKKYQILGKVPFSYRKNTQKPRVQNTIPEKVKRFLEDDANSSLTSGKKEFVKNNGVKKQKRYLKDSLANLHDKFCKDEIKIGYSTFCRYRPPWIVTPNTRDTCLCKLHNNVDLLIGALKRADIIKEGSSSEVLKSICCNASDENCLERKCENCANKTINYQEFSNDATINYYQWQTEKETYKARDGQEKTKTVTIKKKLEDNPRNIVQKLESALPKFLTHVKNIAVQYASIKELKQNLKSDEILIHIDFSENYSLKYNAEIQSFHFGGSRGQVSLHTGVLYYINSETKLITPKSFCTLSKCLQHDAASVWAHLKPILDIAKGLVSSLKVIHFLSDSPTSQYRNKYIFYMMTKLNKQVPDAERITWNYQEAGHGKGAPDGVGAVLKRTADDYVKHGGDVGSFEDFVKIIKQNVKNIRIEIIEEDAILSTKYPQNIPTFKGTMNVHQVIWCISLPLSVAFRRLSCFICEDSYIPCSHNKHLGVLRVETDDTVTCQLNEVENVSFSSHNEISSNQMLNLDIEMTNYTPAINEISVDISAPPTDLNDDIVCLNIDSPTIRNNIADIDDAVLLNEIDDQVLLCDSKNPSPPPDSNEPFTSLNSKVKILSNVEYNWERYSFYNKKSRVFYQHGQDEFKKFISGSTITPTGSQIENPIFMETGNAYEVTMDKHTDGVNWTEKDGKKDDYILMDVDNTYGNITDKRTNEENKTEEDLQKDEYTDNVKFCTQACIEENDKENISTTPPEHQNRSIGDWVIVQYQIKSKLYAYIGKITGYTDGTFTVLFLRRASIKSNTFSWPTINDEDTISESRIFSFLPTPTINRRGQYCFKNLPQLSYK